MLIAIKENLKEALKARDEIKTGTLRMLLAALVNREKEKRYKVSRQEAGLSEQELQKKSQLTQDEIQEVVSSEVKKRREAVEGFEKGGRKEQAEKERQEMEILLSYLPAQLSKDEIRQLVKDAIAKVGVAGPQDLGKVMGALVPQTKGKADGALVAKIVKELLGV